MDVYNWLAYVVSRHTDEMPHNVYVLMTLPPQSGRVLPDYENPPSYMVQPKGQFYGFGCVRFAAEYIERMMQAGGVLRSVTVFWPNGMEVFTHHDMIQLNGAVPAAAVVEVER